MTRLHDEPRQPRLEDEDMTATDEQTVMVPDTNREASPDKGGKVGDLIKRIRGNPWVLGGLIVLIILVAIAGLLYWNDLQSKVYVENSQITAPVISISPTNPGIIDELDVSVGDQVRKDQILAKVGNENLLAKTSGIITGVENTPGQLVNPALDPTPVISMIDPRELRVTGRVQEDKGLKDISPGQHVEFTVDAYPSNQYQGVVEKVAPSSRVGDIVFSISDKRQEQEFDVTVTYDVTAYPELKNGMSAKMWISK
ncbi:HlyD family efflux transporter periplasmic adaptor subunit [Methanoregula sp.]|uniref:HlyD family efflux transporter periplasmic adaptor subunit n=1 Tax=Methanoregula sp. TaxID=2052170 RepID=UPI003C29F73E